MAIRGFEKKDPYAGLNQLMQLMNQMNQMQDRKSARYMSMYDEFDKSSSSFDNRELETNLKRMEDYYSANVSGMSEEDIDSDYSIEVKTYSNNKPYPTMET